MRGEADIERTIGFDRTGAMSDRCRAINLGTGHTDAPTSMFASFRR
jgi:hypothetical protein